MPGIAGGILLAIFGIILVIVGARKGSVLVTGNGRAGIMSGKSVIGLGAFLIVAGVVSIIVGAATST